MKWSLGVGCSGALDWGQSSCGGALVWGKEDRECERLGSLGGVKFGAVWG